MTVDPRGVPDADRSTPTYDAQTGVYQWSSANSRQASVGNSNLTILR
jgi:hypothetical protein